MSKRQPARNPFSFKKIALAIPTGGGGVNGGNEEGSVSGSASNKHLENQCKSIPLLRRVECFPVSAPLIGPKVWCKLGVFGPTTCAGVFSFVLSRNQQLQDSFCHEMPDSWIRPGLGLPRYGNCGGAKYSPALFLLHENYGMQILALPWRTQCNSCVSGK